MPMNPPPGLNRRIAALPPLILLAGASASLLAAQGLRHHVDGPLPPLLLLAGGLLLTALLAALARGATAAYREAERLSRQMTAELDRLATVARRTSNAVVITDLQRRITWVNAGFERMTGYTLAEVQGQSPAALLQCAGSDSGVVAAMRAALGRGEAFHGEFVNRSKDGTPYWVELEVQPLHDAQGRPQGYMAIESDISDRKNAANDLSLERLRLQNILEGTDVGTWEWNVETGETRFNERWAEIVGHTLQTLAPDGINTWTALCHPEDLERSGALLQRHFEGSLPHYECEARIRHRDGHWVWVLDRGKLFARTTDGRPLWMAGTHMDISQRKAAEQALRDYTDRFRLATDSARIGVWSIDLVTREATWDDRTYQLHGLPPDGPMPAAAWRQRVLPEDRARVLAEINAALPSARDFASEFRIRWPGGELRHLRAAGHVVRDEHGQAVRLLGVLLDLTEQRRADEALRASRAFLDSAGRIAGVGAWRVDLVSQQIVWSDVTCRIHEVPPGHQPTLEEAVAFYPGEARQTIERAIADAVAGGNSWDVELPFVTAKGRPLWVRTRGEVERVHGQAVGLVGAFQDVTERRELEAELRRKNDLMSNILAHLPCGLSVVNADLELVASNAEYRRLLDFPDHLFEGRTPRFEDFIRHNAARGEYGSGHTEDIVREMVERARRPAVAHRFERVRPNGTPLEVSGAPMPGGGFVTTYTDISERKRAEREIQRSGELLRGAIDAVDEAFVLFDPEDRLVLCNDKYRQVYAQVADLIVPGARFEDILRGGAERGEYPEAEGRVEAWVAERMATHRAADTTLVQPLADGRTVRIIERRLPDGHTVGFRIDITEMARATEAAREASHAKSRFLANMSHEIRTPMNAVLGMLTLLRKTELTARQDDYAAKTEGAARSLLGLIDDILDFSKVEAGRMTLDPQPFRLDDLMCGLSVILSGSAGHKDVEVIFDLDPALPPELVGDARRLQQVLINLGGNAIKFTPHGEVVVSVAVAGRGPQGVTLDIAVRDTGIGIAPENQERIFSGFTQAEASTTRRYGGTGLGLALCQRLVATMGGTLGLDSTPGVGSRFHFSLVLPVVAGAAAEPRSAEAMHALVVDDHPAAREVLARLVRQLGWTADTAASGEQALAMLHAGARPGVIFMDGQMPGLDGWQTCERIRALASPCDVPLVLLTHAHGREQLAQRPAGERQHLDAVLVKPVTASMLHGALVEARAARAGTALRRVATATAAGGADPRLAGLRLLVSEDNTNNQQIARELLEAEGAEIRIAADGRQAVQAVQAALAAGRPFDAVLMDLQMPVMDGYAATRTLRDDTRCRTLPIVAMTANALPADREQCRAAGMDEHVGKPFDLDHLVAVLRRVTGRAALALPVRATAAGPGTGWPAARRGAAAAAGLEIDAALARLGGRHDVYLRLLRTFVHELAAMPAQLATVLQAADIDAAQRLLHTLRGLAGTLGASALALEVTAAQGTLQAAAPGQALGSAPAMAAVQRTMQETLAALRFFLAGCDDTPAADAALPLADAGPADAATLAPLLRSLAERLAESDMEALALMARLRAGLDTPPGAGWAPRLAALDGAVGRLDFDTALQQCHELLGELNG